MKSFLGSALVFKDFIPNFADLTAPLHDMTHNNFSWDQGTWKRSYIDEFNKLKEAVQASMALHFPDYDQLWILRSDASSLACAAALFQVVNKENGTPSYQRS